jgi:hypothetical protein
MPFFLLRNARAQGGEENHNVTVSTALQQGVNRQPYSKV